MSIWRPNKPTKWAVAYLSLIPVFALVFHFIPHGFYSASLRLEQSQSSEATGLLNDICAALRLASNASEWVWSENSTTGVTIHYGEGGARSGLLVFQPRQEGVGTTYITCGPTISVDDTKAMHFQVQLRPKLLTALEDADPKELYPLGLITYDLDLYPLGDAAGWEGESQAAFPGPRPSKSSNIEAGYLIYYDFRLRADRPPVLRFAVEKGVRDSVIREVESNAFGVRGILPVSADLRDRIVAFTGSASGFTSDTDALSDILRMMYLSVVTVTTLGYGDIIPINPYARIAVALEAVLGLVFAGLFVNAITESRRDK